MAHQLHSHAAKVAAFLKAHKLSAVIIPSADPHLSEYVAPHYRFREWVSGFTGSAGDLVVTSDGKGYLWTDSRYWEQAERQLAGTGIQLMKFGDPGTPSIKKWLLAKIRTGSAIGVDFRLISFAEAQSLSDTLAEKKITLVDTPELADKVWTGRPPLEFQPIYEFEIPNNSRLGKIRKLQEKIRANKVSYQVLTALDDIAWLFNLRGSDIPHTPVFYAYAVIPSIGVDTYLFVHEEALPAEVRAKLENDGVVVKDYKEFDSFLDEISYVKGESSKEHKFQIDLDAVNAKLADTVGKKRRVHGRSPVEVMKACKTFEEIESIRSAHFEDGIAMVKFLCWLDGVKDTGEETEISIAEKLLEFRRQRPGFKDISFETICAFGANAALPHYQATNEQHAKVKDEGFLLIDSGAQYITGTTDITRTIPVGKPSNRMIEDYTAVLRGNIRLNRLVFPEGISSQALDAVARVPLWNDFADYGHGTGHGVGLMLSVHEGPIRISYPRVAPGKDAVVRAETAMHPWMVVSNEPGLYRKGKWGIRIENLIATYRGGSSEFGTFLRFETLTLCPIELSCVDMSRLEPEEKKWLNSYHDKVRRQLVPALLKEGDRDTAEWLQRKTRSIP